MGYLLEGIAVDMVFPTITQKFLMVRLAGLANEDGSGLWPAVDTLAFQMQQTSRSVRYNLTGFRKCGLINVKHEGGNGPGDTTQYELNVDLMIEIALGHFHLAGTKDELELVEISEGKRGNSVPPSAFRRLNQTLLRLNGGSSKGGTGVQPRIPEKPIIEKRAGARASNSPRTAPDAQENRLPRFEDLPPNEVGK